MLRHNGKPRRIPVKPVNTAKNKWLPLLFKIPRKCIAKGIVIIMKRRMNRHSGRLIDHKQILILIYNIKWKLHRNNSIRILLFADLHLKFIPRLQNGILKHTVSVHPDTTRILF